MIDVRLLSDGRSWRGFTDFSINQSLDNVVHAFYMRTTDRLQEGVDRWNIKGGSECEIFLNDNLAFSGFSQEYDIDISGTDHKISIAGYSKIIDVVECSHDGKYFWKSTNFKTVIDEVLAPYGVTIKISKTLEDIPKEGFRVGVNETPFNIIKKIAEKHGMLLFTDSAGNFVMSDGSDATGSTFIGRGDYVGLRAKHNVSKAFSEVIIKSQSNDFKGNFKSAQQIEKRVKNSAETRYRPLIVINNGKEDSQKLLAEYINRRFTGDSVFLEVDLKSPFDKDGNLWGINQSVWFKEDFISVDQELLVAGVTFSLDAEKGFICTLSLRIPQTYRLKGPSEPSLTRATRRASGLFGDIVKALS